VRLEAGGAPQIHLKDKTPQRMEERPDHIDFDSPATLRKWPSLNNQRRVDRPSYLVAEGTLDQCLRDFMAKPESTRHLYEIHTAPQPPLVTAILSPEHIAELARLRDFL
jgi:hypothetical protein